MGANIYETQIKPLLEQIGLWAASGCTDKIIYEALGISKTSWFKYKKAQKELEETITRNRQKSIANVINALYESAIGKYVAVEKAFKCKEVYYDKDNRRCEKESVQTATVKEFIPPQIAGISFFLKNMDRGGSWSDNPEMLKLKREQFQHQKHIDEENNF